MTMNFDAEVVGGLSSCDISQSFSRSLLPSCGSEPSSHLIESRLSCPDSGASPGPDQSRQERRLIFTDPHGLELLLSSLSAASSGRVFQSRGKISEGACTPGEVREASEGLRWGNSRRLLDDEGVVAPVEVNMMGKLP